MGKVYCPLCGHSDVEKIGENKYRCRCTKCKCDVTWLILTSKV